MGDPAIMNQLVLSEHTGTHVDAPSHFPESSAVQAIDEVDLRTFAGPARCLHVTRREGDGWQLGAAEVEAWEAEHGALASGEILLIDFGWAKRWALGADGFGYLTGWPGLALDAVELLRTRRIAAVGTDCVGLDAAGSTELPSHRGLLPEGILIYENLANLDQLGYELFFIGFPLKIGQGTGSPVRALGLVAD